MDLSQDRVTVERALNQLVTLQLFKSWNIYATRIFYFAAKGTESHSEGDWRLSLECPWRIELQGKIVVGSEDYGVRGDANTDPDWNPTEMQSGNRQDEILSRLLGASKSGSIFNTGSDFIVESAEADSLGGFRLAFSGGYRLSVFPASSADMEWLLSGRDGYRLALLNGTIQT